MRCPSFPPVVGSFFSYSGTSPQFIYLFVVSACSFIGEKTFLAPTDQEKENPGHAVGYLIPGILLFLWGQYVSAIDMVHLSFLLLIFGTARLLAGKMLTRLIFLPLCILLLATPLPAALMNQLIFMFQLWDANHSTWLLNAVGIPASALGDMIYLADTKVRVAESCTALGFLKWLAIIALTYAYIFPVTRLHGALLILSAPFIAYAVNLLRIITLTLNPKLSIATIHTAQGILFFMIGFILLYAVDSLLLHTLKRSETDASSAHKNPSNYLTQQHLKSILLSISMVSVLLISTVALPRWASSNTASDHLSLPKDFKGWRLAATPTLHYKFIGSVRYSKSLLRRYRKDNTIVSLFIGFDNRQDRFRSFLSEKNAYPGRIGRVEKRSTVALGNTGQSANAILTSLHHQKTLSYYWYSGTESVSKEILYALFALDQSPFQRKSGALVVRISTPVTPLPKGLQQAEQRLQKFLEDMTVEALNNSAQKKRPDIKSGLSSTHSVKLIADDAFYTKRPGTATLTRGVLGL